MIPKFFSKNPNSGDPSIRVLAAHDISCFGRCSLTMALPVLSAFGVQTVPLPTALLSTHTGGFADFSFIDLTDEMEKIIDHFERLDLRFDAIYSGFLGSERQTRIIERAIDRFGGNGATILVDPVLGDDGELYQTMTRAMVEGMRRLVSRADIITPNITEACALAGISHIYSPSDEQIRALCEKLCAMGARSVVITGIERGDRIVVAVSRGSVARVRSSSLDRICAAEDVSFIETPRVARDYPGTGDLFASALLGRTLLGDDIFEAAQAAAHLVGEVMSYSAAHDYPERNGVLIEKKLKEFLYER